MTDGAALRAQTGGELLVCVQRTLHAGVDWVQVREQHLPGRELLSLACAASQIAPKGSRIFVNDRLDIAVAARAHGIHLGNRSAPAADVAAWRLSRHASPEFLIGVSCHSLVEGQNAESAGADYVFFGPVFATPSKQSYGPPQGIASLAEISERLNIPVIAIGGITEQNAAACIRAGAGGIAAIRLFQESRDSAMLVHRIRDAIRSAIS